MIDDTLKKIEAKIQAAPTASPESKAELLKLLAELHAELGKLGHSHAEQAQSIAGFAEVAAHEATRGQRRPELAEHARQGLVASVGEFESTHMRLVGIVRQICDALANVGI